MIHESFIPRKHGAYKIPDTFDKTQCINQLEVENTISILPENTYSYVSLLYQ